jgi:opacity protein-like surface antigen
MLNRFTCCAITVLVIALCPVSSAVAQQAISLVPADTPRWQVAAGAGWFGRAQTRSTGLFVDDIWLNAGSVAASIGYQWAPHLNLTGEVGTTSNGSFYTYEPVTVPGRPTPVFQSREHGVQTRTVSAAVQYQFFENRWIHPFVAAGVEIAHERDRIESIVQPILGPDGRAGIPVPSVETKTTRAVRPTLGGGFKFYVTERAFIDTGVRFSFDRDGLVSSSWRSGVGFDF